MALFGFKKKNKERDIPAEEQETQTPDFVGGWSKLDFDSIQRSPGFVEGRVRSAEINTENMGEAVPAAEQEDLTFDGQQPSFSLEGVELEGSEGDQLTEDNSQGSTVGWNNPRSFLFAKAGDKAPQEEALPQQTVTQDMAEDIAASTNEVMPSETADPDLLQSEPVEASDSAPWVNKAWDEEDAETFELKEVSSRHSDDTPEDESEQEPSSSENQKPSKRQLKKEAREAEKRAKEEAKEAEKRAKEEAREADRRAKEEAKEEAKNSKKRAKEAKAADKQAKRDEKQALKEKKKQQKKPIFFEGMPAKRRRYMTSHLLLGTLIFIISLLGIALVAVIIYFSGVFIPQVNYFLLGLCGLLVIASIFCFVRYIKSLNFEYDAAYFD